MASGGGEERTSISTRRESRRRPTLEPSAPAPVGAAADNPQRPALSNVAWRVVQNLRTKIQSKQPEDVEMTTVSASANTDPYHDLGWHRRHTLTKIPRAPMKDSTRREVDFSSLNRVARDDEFVVTLTTYDQGTHSITHATTLPEVKEMIKGLATPSTQVRWAHIEPLCEQVLVVFADALQLNATAVQDALHFPQRPSFEAYDHCIALLLQAPSLDDPANCFSGLNLLQLSVFLCQGNIVLSSCLKHADLLSPIRTKLRLPASALRQGDAAFLVNAIITQVQLAMKLPMDPFGDLLSDLEQEILTRPDRAAVRKVHFLRRELGMLRQQIWPTRELLAALQQSASPLLTLTSRKYFSSNYDQVVQLIDLLETYRELGTGLLELFASRTSKQLGHIIRAVTMLQVLFLPAIFFAAVYGMNFACVDPWTCGRVDVWSCSVVGFVFASVFAFQIEGRVMRMERRKTRHTHTHTFGFLFQHLIMSS
eukprot:m.144918 g.144918  ORF g.144918 m.144918 type:complete len:481 (-) comp15019_c1_seq10:129-1571(-)